MKTIEERQAETMVQAHKLWDRKREASQKAHDGLLELAEVVFEEYTTVRGCSKEAAFGMVRDVMERYGDAGIEVQNKLYFDKM
jgi:hypothetical protein